MSNPRPASSDTSILLTLLAGWLLRDFTSETSTSPPAAAQAYAMLASVALIVWWIWYLRRSQAPTPAPSRQSIASPVAVIACTFALWLTEQVLVTGIFRDTTTIADVVTDTWSAKILSAVTLPLAGEALLRVYLLSKIRMHMSIGEAALTCAILATVVGGSVTHLVSNALLSAFLTLLVLDTGRLWTAPVVHVTIAVLAVLQPTAVGPVAHQTLTVAVLCTLAIGAGAVFLARTSKSIFDSAAPHESRHGA